jgi:hypothetical protein
VWSYILRELSGLLVKVMVTSRDIYVLVCVSMDLLLYCVVMMCGFLADVVCVLYFVYLWFWYVSPLEQVLVGTPSHF